MNKEQRYLAEKILEDPKIMTFLGFTPIESNVLYYIAKGNSPTDIAIRLNIPKHKVEHIKNKCLPMVPVYLYQKLELLTNVDLKVINSKLKTINTSISQFLNYFKSVQVFHIRELNLSRRTRNALTAHHINNTNDLTNYSRDELLHVKNIGSQAISEIEIALEILNMKLKE